MTERLIKLQGEKLPQEAVWVDQTMMYEVNDPLVINIDGEGEKKYFIVDVIEDGIVAVQMQQNSRLANLTNQQ